LVAVLALALLPAPVYVAGSRSYEANLYSEPEAATVAAAPPARDPAKRTVAVVVGNEGANIADALVSYEVLAATRAFNVHTVAPERRPVPLLGGSAPDATVVPALPDSEPAVTAWVRDTASRGCCRWTGRCGSWSGSWAPTPRRRPPGPSAGGTTPPAGPRRFLRRS
jgi:hypothetical protein